MKLKVKRIKTAEGIAHKFASLTFGAKLSKNGFGIGTMTADGKIRDMDKKEFVEAIEHNGIWGFVDKPKNTIYIWAKESTPVETLVGFFAHEIGHTVGKPFVSVLKEENRVEEYAVVAKEAYKLAVSVSKEERIERLRIHRVKK